MLAGWLAGWLAMLAIGDYEVGWGYQVVSVCFFFFFTLSHCGLKLHSSYDISTPNDSSEVSRLHV